MSSFFKLFSKISIFLHLFQQLHPHFFFAILWMLCEFRSHLCRPVRSTFAVRETASLGIMGAPIMPRGSPIMPRDAVSRTANVVRTGRHKWVKLMVIDTSILICNSNQLDSFVKLQVSWLDFTVNENGKACKSLSFCIFFHGE